MSKGAGGVVTDEAEGSEYDLRADLGEREDEEEGSRVYAASLQGSLTLYTDGTRLPPSDRSEGYGLRPRDRLRAPPRYNHQMPLIYKGPATGEVYQPFSYTDMNCILDKMPPPTEGGGPWMSKFCQLTLGHKLALGDWRAMVGRQLGTWEIQQLEAAAGISTTPDKESFARYATTIGRVMRDKFPIPEGAMHGLTFTIKEDEDMSAFLSRCKNTWTDSAGSHPGSGQLQTTLFRKAVMAGMPNPVKEAMESNPDIPGCSTEQWEKHLTHHMKRYRAKQEEEKQSTESAQVQLLKLQLDEARRKVNEAKKSNSKPANQMVQQPQPQTRTPDLYPIPDWAPHPHYGGGPAGVTGGMRGRGRGRGGPMGPGHMASVVCFACGQPGHYKRNCPQLWGPGGNTPPPPPPRGGFGPPNQGPARQMAPPYQAPYSAAAPPQGQYPQTTYWEDNIVY